MVCLSRFFWHNYANMNHLPDHLFLVYCLPRFSVISFTALFSTSFFTLAPFHSYPPFISLVHLLRSSLLFISPVHLFHSSLPFISSVHPFISSVDFRCSRPQFTPLEQFLHSNSPIIICGVVDSVTQIPFVSI